MAGRVDTDHHRSVNARRVAPGVDHGRASARALAQQVDAVIAERAARRVQIIDPLGQRVSGEIDAIRLQPVRTCAKSLRISMERLFTKEVRRSLQCGRDLRTGERRRPVDPAIADQDNVVTIGDPAGLGELHVREPGSAFEPEHRRTRMRRPSPNPLHRQGNQPRLRVGSVLRNDQCPAVGGVAAVLRAVVARLQHQVAGLCALGHGDPLAVGSEPEIPQPEDQQPHEHKGGDSSGREGTCRQGIAGRVVLGSSHRFDARNGIARRHRPKAASDVRPDDDPESYSSRRRHAQGSSTFTA